MSPRGTSFALILLATLALACGGRGETATGSQTAVSTGLNLTIEGRAFGSAPEVAAGEGFTIINLDSVRHTFSSADGSWEQVDLAGDSQVSFTVPESLAAGRYIFFCAIHSDMGGSLSITG